MYNGKTFLAFIPARSGSKGLIDKNIKELCGKPLIAWSIEAGINSKYIDEVIVSTDSEKYASIAERFGARVPFLRPPHISTDTASTFEVIQHFLNFYKKQQGREYDYVVLLEPTSPLREKDDIDKMIEKIVLTENNFDSIISIGEVHEHPSIMKRINNNGSMSPYCNKLKMASRRQDNPISYFPYGVAYIVKTDSLLEEETFYPERTTFYTIKRYQCYEIDDIYDFLAIENIMKFEWKI